MDYSLDLTLSPEPALQPVARRLFAELAQVREGPGEEMERLAAAVEPVIGSALAALNRLGGQPALRLQVHSSEVRVDIVMEAAAGGREPLGKDPDAVLAHLAGVFDEVEPPADDDGPFRLALVRHIPC